MAQGQRRSRSPSPEPRSRSRANDVTASKYTLSSQASSVPEERDPWVAAKGGSGDRDRQAGGDTNTPQHSPSRTPSTQHVLTLLSEPDVPPHNRSGSVNQVNPTVTSNQQQHQYLKAVPQSQEQREKEDLGKVAANARTPKPNNIRDKVGALLAKYGRQEAPGEVVEEAGKVGSGGGSPCSSHSSSSSYEIIDVIDMAHNSSFEDLEWDADHMMSNGHHDADALSLRQSDDWDELRAAVAANMAAHIHNPHNLSDSDEEEEIFQVPVYAGISNRGDMRNRSQDDCSDTLSVITELTEPDEDIYQLEKDMFTMSHSSMTGSSRTHPIDAFDCDKDYGYFTLPGKGAVSRTESMRSAAESEVSHNSITPSSDMDTDLSMSQLSDTSNTSATESAQDSKRHSIDKHDTLDDMMAYVDQENDLPDLDDMYRINLQILDEADLKGLTLPSLASLKPPRSDPLPRKFPALRNQDIRLSDRKIRKPDAPRTINSLTAVFETEKNPKAKRDTWPPRDSDSAQLSGGNRRQMPKTQSDSKLRVMRERDSDMSVSPELQRKRSQLRSVRSEKSLSYPLGDGVKIQEEKPVDRSHLASISALTKMFDHPPSYLRPSVGYPVHKVEEKPSDIKTQSPNSLQVEPKIHEDVKDIGVESVTVHMSEKPASVVNETFTLVIERNLEAERKEVKSAIDKNQEENTVKAAKGKKEKKSKTKTKKVLHAIGKDVVDKDSRSSHKIGLTDEGEKIDTTDNSANIKLSKSATKTKSPGHVAAEQSNMKDVFSEPKPDITPDLPSLVREDNAKVTRRAPSPTVQAVQEKVGATRSIPLREIICEELEREVLGNVSDIDQHHSQYVFPGQKEAADVNVIHKESSQLSPRKQVTKAASPEKPFVLSSPSEVELEVEQQLENWKRKREQKRRSTSQNSEEEAQSLYTQFELGTSNTSFRTSTPPRTKDRNEATQLKSESRDYIKHVQSSSMLPEEEAKPSTEKAQLSISKQVEASLQVASAAGVYAGSEAEHPESDHSTDKADTSYELEAAFLAPRVPTPADGHSLQTARSGIRPQPPIPSDIDGDDNQAAESTESTLTPEPDWLGATVYTPNLVHRDTDSDAISELYEEEEDEEEEDDLEEVSELSELSEEQDALSCSSVDGSRQPNGHGDASSVTSSLTESDAGSGSPRVTSRREHKTSITSVPSINITHHDSAPEAESGRDEDAVAAAAAAAAAVVADTQARGAGEPSVGQGSGTEGEECEDIDELVASHTSPSHSIHSQKGGSMLSPFSGSRESIVSFYSDAGEGTYGNIPVTGEIQFALDYNYKTGSLELKVKQCRDLAPVDTKKKRSDPYVKVYLLPDKTKSGKRKTRVKKHTLNPVFDEVLKYAITKSELETRTLWMTVWHSDMFGRNDFLGEVTIPLDYYSFGEKEPQWYKLQERNASPLSLLTYKGDLILSLRYVTGDNAPSAGGKVRGGGNTSKRRPGSGELHVLLKEARNLTAVRANGFSDPFCKGYLLPDKGRGTKQKTPVAKRDCNPQWNHTFVFEDVSLEDLRDRSLELTVWDHDRFTSNDFLGGLRLNIGAGKVGGKEVDWMDSRGEEVSMWQAMLDRPNCWIDGSLMLRTTMERRK